MDRAIDQASMTLDYRAFKALIGVLAIVAAVAAGSGTAMTASLFGALAALALSAGAALSALLELAASDRDRAGGRYGAVPGGSLAIRRSPRSASRPHWSFAVSAASG
jgi:hypothetical protein